jgi:hypothetical protein
MGKNSTNRDDCCESPDFNSIYTDFIGNPDGPFQIFDDILPSVDDTYNVGSAILRWKNGYYSVSLFCPRLTSTSADLTLDASAGFSVVSKKSVVPDTDILHSCGFSNKRWLNVHGKTIFTETVTTLTGSDLTLSASSGQVIQNTQTIRPSTNLGNDLGTSSFRYANVYGQTINSTTINNTTLNTTTANATTVNTTTLVTTNINATTSQNLALSADTGYVITANKNIQPFVDSTTNLGSASKKWQTTYTNNVNATTVNTGSVVTNSISANPTVDLTFFADSGKSVILNNPLLPVTDNTIPLGSASKQWSDIRATQSTISTMNATTLVINNTITTPPGVDLHLTTDTGYNIVCFKVLRPYQDVTLTCGALNERWLELYTQTVYTNLVQSFTGSNLELQAPVGNLISAKSSLWPFDNLVQSLGNTSNRWLNVYGQTLITETVTTPTGKDLLLDADTGYDILANKNLLPNSTETYTLGSTAYKWNNTHTITTTTNTVISNTSTDLTLDAASGQLVTSKKTVVPFSGTLDLGSASQKWLNVHGYTVHANEVKTNSIIGGIGADLIIDPGTGTNLVSSKSFIPITTNVHSLGNSSFRWKDLYVQNTREDTTNVSTTFLSTASTLSATTFTNVALSSISNASWDDTSSTFKFPTSGWYQLSFTSTGDVGTLSANRIEYRIRESGGATFNEQIHIIGSSGDAYVRNWQYSQMFYVNNTSDRWNIQVRRTNANVTNWTVLDGVIVRLVAT